jgi:hypothetical protein
MIGFLVAHSGSGLVQQQQSRLQRERHHDLVGPLVAMAEFATGRSSLSLSPPQGTVNSKRRISAFIALALTAISAISV